MANIFTIENVADFSEKINMDELYEKKKQYDLSKLELFNKILNRIHVRIKTTSRQKIDEHFCWFVVPEIIIGVPKYDQGACVAYLMDKLKANGFAVRYIHPNALFISWNHFIPSYVRTELKKKTGIVIDEYGRQIDKDGIKKEITMEPKNLNEGLFKMDFQNGEKDNKPLTKSQQQQLNNKKFTPIQSYKPKGNFVYDDSFLSSLENKFS
jgi:hypothetical protein